MNRTVTDDELDNLLNFIGYGRLDADIWFLGREETSFRPEKILDRINFEQVEDSHNAVELLGSTLQQFNLENMHQAWSGISQIMLMLEGKPTTEEHVQDYLAERLGRADGAVLACELLPIPATADHAWGYQGLIPQYSSGEAYYKEIKPLRYDFYRQIIIQYRPKVVVAYGKDTWAEYEELFKDYKLADHENFKIGWNTETVIILCDHFSEPGAVEHLEKLVDVIEENSLPIETDKRNSQIPLSKAELARRTKEAARKAAQAKRKPTTKHNPADPYCVCAYCLGYENE